MNPLTKYLVIASYGVWEVLSNKQVMDIVDGFYESKNAQAAASKILEIARKKWIKVI